MDITVLMHDTDPPLSFYWLGAISQIWLSKGHRVFEQHGLSRPVRGDVIFLHVDRTVIPEEYMEAVEGLPNVANGAVADISKTRVSRNRVLSRDDGWDGPVIVKTVQNHGGGPERRARRRTVSGRLQNLVGRVLRLSMAHADSLHPYHYPIYDSARHVPEGAFRNPALIVERFVPERHGEYYCHRTYDFLGDQWHSDACYTRAPVARYSTNEVIQLVPVHEAIVAARRRMQFDYGTFDYVVRDGEAILLDTNRTPGIVEDLSVVWDELCKLALGVTSLAR